MRLDIITAKEAGVLIKGRHYLGATEYQPTFCFATPERDAVAIYSPPVAQHFKVKLSKPLELVRLWQADEQTRRVGKFLASSIRALRKLSPESDCLFSYADPGQLNPHTGEPHTGTVYRATGWEYFGPSRVTDYWLDEFNEQVSSPVMYRRHKTKSRELLGLFLGYKLVEKPPKHLYVYGMRKTPAEVREIIGGRYAKINSG
jgi:hypothetical protein